MRKKSKHAFVALFFLSFYEKLELVKLRNIHPKITVYLWTVLPRSASHF